MYGQNYQASQGCGNLYRYPPPPFHVARPPFWPPPPPHGMPLSAERNRFSVPPPPGQYPVNVCRPPPPPAVAPDTSAQRFPPPPGLPVHHPPMPDIHKPPPPFLLDASSRDPSVGHDTPTSSVPPRPNMLHQPQPYMPFNPNVRQYYGWPPPERPPFGPRGIRSPAFQPPQLHKNGPRYRPAFNNVGNKRKANDDFNNYQVKKKKPAKNKLDKAEDYTFYCDRCDRGFKTDEKFQEHNSQHQQCRVEGCTYIAAPKLVQLHYEFQHKTGFAKKIWQLESAEELEQWVTDRKRNYPTAENKERKRKELEERRAARQKEWEQRRAERANNNSNGKDQQWNKGQQRHEGQRPQKGQRSTDGDHKSLGEDGNAKIDSGTISKENVQVTAVEQDVESNVSSVVTPGAVAASSNGVATATTSTTTPNKRQKSKKRGNKKKWKKTGKQAAQQKLNTSAVINKSFLQQKLASADVRHARNIILQCVKFLVKEFNLHDRNSQQQQQLIEVNALDVVELQDTVSCTVSVDGSETVTADTVDIVDTSVESISSTDVSDDELDTTGEKLQVSVDISKPTRNEPKLPEPTVSEPRLAEPEPNIMEPSLDEPSPSEPNFEPPTSHEPNLSDPDITELNVHKPDQPELFLNQPNFHEPNLPEPNLSESSLPEPPQPDIQELNYQETSHCEQSVQLDTADVSMCDHHIAEQPVSKVTV